MPILNPCIPPNHIDLDLPQRLRLDRHKFIFNVSQAITRFTPNDCPAGG